MIPVSFNSCIAAESVSITIRNALVYEDRRLCISFLHTPTLDYYNDLSHVRDGLFIKFSTAADLIETRAVGKRCMSTHDAPEMRNQYLGRVLPFLKDASGDEVDVYIAPLQPIFYQQRCTLDDTVSRTSLTVSLRFSEYPTCQRYACSMVLRRRYVSR